MEVHKCISLLRLIPTDGEVYFDGLATSSLNLESLRGAITIIPQQPELMVCELTAPSTLRFLTWSVSLDQFEITSIPLLSMMTLFSMMPCVPQAYSISKRT